MKSSVIVALATLSTTFTTGAGRPAATPADHEFCWTTAVTTVANRPVEANDVTDDDDARKVLRFAFTTPSTDQCSIRVTFRATWTSDPDSENEFVATYRPAKVAVDRIDYFYPEVQFAAVWDVEATARPPVGDASGYNVDDCYNGENLNTCTQLQSGEIIW